jgi:hypothetical protein
MGARALHPRRQAAAVCLDLAAANESVVPAAVHWDVRAKYRAAARGFLSAAGLDFPWAAAVPLVEQGDELPERRARRPPAALQRVVCPGSQLRVEAAWLRAAREQPGERASACRSVPQASQLQGYLLAQEPVPSELFSAPQEQWRERGSRELGGPLVLLRARQEHQEQSASQRLEFLCELAKQPAVRLASYAQPSRQLPSLLSPLWQQLLPELLLLQPLEFSFVLSPQRRRESNWSVSFSPRRRNWTEGQ